MGTVIIAVQATGEGTHDVSCVLQVPLLHTTCVLLFLILNSFLALMLRLQCIHHLKDYSEQKMQAQVSGKSLRCINTLEKAKKFTTGSHRRLHHVWVWTKTKC